ncbi:hypothetical protein CC78DRAFT_86646 [Lojkania enalia]|uniref:Uncharacterized protein n=1 Tax=Lojkania enalia TaxID=147567 RepID=A0A9P4JXK9_9PLEO|nr:hypothetical protein CC78DRAFT_86646 [Didymosphaeria enalia]
MPQTKSSKEGTTAMPAPLAKGLIIAASVLVAAGIALYESPQVRQWVDQSRRKIAIALHSLGDEIQPRPRRTSESSQDYEARRRKEESLRRRKSDLIRRAREEGVAVDLDELARLGEEVEMRDTKQGKKNESAGQRSFDDLVGKDGMLKDIGSSTGAESTDKGVRRRGVVGFKAGAAAANPFADQVLFDQEEEEAPSPKPFFYVESRESTATVEEPENPQTASIPQSEAEDMEQAAQSFYSFTTSASDPQHLDAVEVLDAENVSTGTLTPRSDSAFTGASIVGSAADDIAVLSTHEDDHDARSEAFSEAGFTDAGFSEAGFSEVSERRMGVMTPSSWTDVGSDDESEWGGPGQGGQVHQ